MCVSFFGSDQGQGAYPFRIPIQAARGVLTVILSPFFGYKCTSFTYGCSAVTIPEVDQQSQLLQVHGMGVTAC